MDAEDTKVRTGSRGLAAAGWALGALVVAVALSFGTEILFVDVLDEAIDPLTGGAVVPEWIQAIGTAVIVGGAVGAVVGSRVAHAVPLAIVTTLVYVALWPFATLIGREGFVGALVLLHVGAAAGVAHLVQRRRRPWEHRT